jgi:hypothetical protein
MFKKIMMSAVVTCLAALFSLSGQAPQANAPKGVFPGADETTVSQAHFFTWINNTSGGSPEKQTMINLDFFRWLKTEYGLQLDIYAFDADILDGSGGYHTLKSPKFLKNYPQSFGPVSREAASLGIRLGVWLGPDGFGDTPQEERERIDMFVSLCKDYHFRLFKIDALSELRPEKQDSFIRAMTLCRESTPDLIVLNHRVDFGKAAPYVTTTLWNGDETYIDVHMVNSQTATHHRAGAISRGLTPGLKRLLEDHGVCLSSCLDYWEDDLVMQAFNRCLLLAPELYGNPWFLRDDEYPRLARLFNLHRKYRDILVKGMVLPEGQFGKSAVSRGDDTTRLLTLANLTWDPVKYVVSLDDSIGLKRGKDVVVVQYHPSEKILGRFAYGTKATVEVLPFRSCLLLASTAPFQDTGLSGCTYDVVRDVPGKDVVIKVLGYPGSTERISLVGDGRAYRKATLDGREIPGLLRGKSVEVRFPGERLMRPWHRKLADLQPGPIPQDAESLYEASCYAADNNALEVRSLDRSGPTKIPQVQKARDAFFTQPVFIERGVWDKNLFDGDMTTEFNVNNRLRDFKGGALRVDLGRPTRIDTLAVKLKDAQAVQAYLAGGEPVAETSTDLRAWSPAKVTASENVLTIATAADAKAARYVRLLNAPVKILEIEGLFRGKRLDRSEWRASNLFGWYGKTPAVKSWSGSFVLDEAAKGSYLAIPLEGLHGREGAFAALRVGGRLVGAPDRSVSYPTNVWEFRVESKAENYTYYVPVTPEMIRQKIEVVVLGQNKDMLDFKPEAWITAYPIPFESRELVLQRAKTE